MSGEASGPADQAAINRLLRRLDGFARGLEPDDAAARRIARDIVADMPSRLDEERLAEARTRMLTEGEEALRDCADEAARLPCAALRVLVRVCPGRWGLTC